MNGPRKRNQAEDHVNPDPKRKLFTIIDEEMDSDEDSDAEVVIIQSCKASRPNGIQDDERSVGSSDSDGAANTMRDIFDVPQVSSRTKARINGGNQPLNRYDATWQFDSIKVGSLTYIHIMSGVGDWIFNCFMPSQIRVYFKKSKHLASNELYMDSICLQWVLLVCHYRQTIYSGFYLSATVVYMSTMGSTCLPV